MKFKVFIESIRNKYPFDDIILMMDNLSLHKGPDLRALYDKLGFLYTFTPVYSP
jgi:transposase